MIYINVLTYLIYSASRPNNDVISEATNSDG